MDWRNKFRFSLANIMLMMVPLAVVSTVVSYGIWLPSIDVVVAAIVVGIAPIVGALFGGRTGLGIGCLIGYFVFLFLVFFGILDLEKIFRLRFR